MHVLFFQYRCLVSISHRPKQQGCACQHHKAIEPGHYERVDADKSMEVLAQSVILDALDDYFPSDDEVMRVEFYLVALLVPVLDIWRCDLLVEGLEAQAIG